MEEHIQRNMIMMYLSQLRMPRCLECGYYFMNETMHEYGPSIGGISYYKCPNCGFEINSRDMHASE
jgi:predicted Zn-ribbon and HTH transcriptional regulator